MKKIALVVAAMSGLSSSFVLAEAYLGGKAGYTMLQDSCTLESMCEEESFSGGVYIGANGNDYLGVELGYDWLGKFKTDMQTGTRLTEGDISAMTLAPKLRYPFGDASVYGKLGAARLELGDFKDTSYFGALGFEYNLSEKFTTRLEYQRIQDAFSDELDDVNIDSVFLGIAYRFGGGQSTAKAPVQTEPVPEPVVEVASVKEPVAKVETRPEPIKKKKIFKEYGVELFESNSTQLNVKSLSYFDWIVDTMKAFPQAKLTLVGHTDSVGAAEYNQALSEKRAQSVADYLQTQGINKSRVQVTGKGEAEPKASNSTAAGRMENRRVEVIIDEFEYEAD